MCTESGLSGGEGAELVQEGRRMRGWGDRARGRRATGRGSGDANVEHRAKAGRRDARAPKRPAAMKAADMAASRAARRLPGDDAGFCAARGAG